MRCTSLAVWLGTSLLLAFPGVASAQIMTQGYPPSHWTWGCNNGASFGARATAWLNQQGPLYNYGPYYGYYPFEPYGPWNAYLQYNPWYYGYPEGGNCHGCNHGDLNGHGPLCNGGHSWHSSWALGGWFHGCSSCSHGGVFTNLGHGHFAPSCDCGITGSVSQIGVTPKAAFNPETTNPLTRCEGIGSPAEFAAFYNGLPTLDLTTTLPAAGER